MSQRKVSHENAPSPDPSHVNGSTIGQSPELDIEQFRIPQDFGAHLQARKTAVTVSVRKPDRQYWVFIHPDHNWWMSAMVLEDKTNQRTYVVLPEIVPEVVGDLVPKLLVTYQSRQGNTSLWPIRMPDESGRLDTFNESALAIVDQHAGQWIRVLVNQADRCYDVLEMPAIESPAPKWPEGGFNQLFALAFKKRIIDNINHPVLKALRGETL